jgi:hypothetical protein
MQTSIISNISLRLINYKIFSRLYTKTGYIFAIATLK